jgi:catechol 2,3-dioxygenase-like lactoylglutathione lyase family enzyme
MAAEKFLTGIQHVGIPTENLDATVQFYKALGFDIVQEEYLKDADGRVKFLKMNNLVIETYDAKDTAKKAGGIDHIALDVNDIDAAWEFAKEKDLNIVEDMAALPFWSKGIKCFKVEGPNKELVEFCQIL